VATQRQLERREWWALQWARFRASFWGLYERYWEVRERLAKDRAVRTAVTSAVTVLGTPIAGAVAAAALQIDRHLAPEMRELSGTQEALALMIVDELVEEGRITAGQAETLARETLATLADTPAEEAPRPRTRAWLLSQGPRPGVLSPSDKSTPPPLWPMALGVLAIIFFLRGT